MKISNWGNGKKLLVSIFILTLIMTFSSNNLVGKEIKSRKPQDVKNITPISEHIKLIKLDDVLFASGPNDIIPVIVRFNDHLLEAGYNQIGKRIGKFTTKYRYNIIPGMAADLTKEQIETLKKVPDVEDIEYDNRAYAMSDTATYWFGADDIQADYGLTGAGLAVAVIDTGIDPGHVDLDNGKIVGWKDFVTDLTAPYDDNGHGTHVSSIATGTGEGNPTYKGVAPGASLVGVKVLDGSGSGWWSDIIAGIDWCVTNKNAFTYPIKVMNISLGASGSSDGTDSVSVACNNAMDAGIVVVLAAINDGPSEYTIGSPAAAEKPITVGAMVDIGHNGFYQAYFSSRGPTADNRIKPDICAPGVNIMAAQRGTATGYVEMSGTSMASPFVAGMAALMLQNNPALTPNQVKSTIMNTAAGWGPPGPNIDYGSGRLDGYKAINGITSKPPVPSHMYESGSLTGTGDFDLWTYNITDISYPMAVTMIMDDWPDCDFDLKVFDPNGAEVDSSTWTDREEEVGFMPTITGSYQVRVYSFSGSGSYFFDVSAGFFVAPLPPVANNDSYETNKNTPLTIPTPGVLVNDADPNGDTLTAEKVTNTSHGTVVLNANGSFTYTPTTGYVGNDSFTYKAYDGSLYGNVATVNLKVNGPPVAVNNSYSVDEDPPPGLTAPAPGVLSNDTDPNGDTLTAEKVTDPAHGTLVLNANGSFTYTPVTNYNGSDSFTYKAYDGLTYSNVAIVNITVNPVNDAPIAFNDGSYIMSDSTLGGYVVYVNGSISLPGPGVLGNDSDVDDDPLTAEKVTDPTHGTLVLNVNGAFTYTPTTGYAGKDSFTYRAKDTGSPSLYSNVATVNLIVTPKPEAVDDVYRNVNKNTPLTIPMPGVLGNDIEAYKNPLTAIKVTDPAKGTVVLNANGSFTYTPTPNYVGWDRFTYKANNGLADSNVATVFLKVNGPPVAVNDSYKTNINTPLTVPVPGVLANDTDPDGDALTAIKVTDPAHGTLVLNANGALTYTPTTGYSGNDSFTYKAYDGLAYSNVVTVSLKINGPSIAVNDSYKTNINTSLTIPVPGVLANDTDPDGDALTAIKVTDPAHGTLVLNANGALTYTPTTGYSGNDSFTYKAYDGLAYSNVVTVSLKVNGPPVAVDDIYRNVSNNAPLTVPAPGVLANDTDPNGDALTAIKVTDPAKGTVILNANGSFTYTPTPNYVGWDRFTYKTYDGSLYSNVATVFLKVNGPPVAVNDSYKTNINTPLTVPVPGVLANDTDPDGDALTAIKVTDSAHGTVVLNANGSFTYTSTTGYSGNDSFTYKAYDGLAYSNVVTVSLKVNGPPVAVNDSYKTNINTPLTISVPGVLANDTDPDGDALTAIKVTDPAHGTLVLNANGSLTYTPTTGYAGNDSFTYKAYDGLAYSNVVTVSLKVNGPPVAVDDIYRNVSNNAPLTVPVPGVLANDTDPNGDALTAIKVTDPAKGTVVLNANGSFTYTPTPNYVGWDRFTYKTYDGSLYSNVATVFLKVNGPPVAVNDSYKTNINTPLTVPVPGVLANDTDPDGDALTAIKVTDSAHGTVVLNANGSFTYTPTTGYAGNDSFTYKAYDGLAYSNVVTVSLKVNGPPVAVNDSYKMNINTPLTILAPGVLANDTDPDGDALTAIKVTDPAHGTLVLNANGAFTYTPTTGYVGNDSFTYKAYDGSLYSNVATVFLKVNGPPVAVDDIYRNVSNNAPLTVPAPGVLANDTDPNGDALTAIKVTDPAKGTVILNANGSFTYTPTPNYVGWDRFTYKTYDGSLYSNVATVYLSIIAQAALLANFPNPFNPETWIPFALSNNANVEIMIYSSVGQLVRKLNLGHKSAGSYIERNKSAYWDGRNEAGEQVSSGVYFYTIKAGDFTATKKMIMQK